MSSNSELAEVRLALPKGRMFDQVVNLLKSAGISIRNSERGYRPSISLANYTAKIPVSYTHLTLPTTPYV